MDALPTRGGEFEALSPCAQTSGVKGGARSQAPQASGQGVEQALVLNPGPPRSFPSSGEGPWVQRLHSAPPTVAQTCTLSLLALSFPMTFFF